MGITFSIIWRASLTLAALVFLASCGSEQPITPSAPPVQGQESPPAAPTLQPLPSQAPLTPTTSSSSSGSAVRTPTLVFPSVGGPGANPTPKLTVTLADDNKAITLPLGDRFLLDLSSSFDWQVSIENPNVLRQVPNSSSKDNQGLFEAVAVGKTTLTATGNPPCYNAVPRCLMPSRLYTLHVTVAGASASSATITLADQGRTITLAVGATALVDLGEDYTWTVNIQDPTILSRDTNRSNPKGAQGVYVAKKPGTTMLVASGGINCPPQKACIQIAREFSVRIVVQ